MTRECPMCSEIMRLRTSEHVQKIPGTNQMVRREYREWVCPECDYFEEIETDEVDAS